MTYEERIGHGEVELSSGKGKPVPVLSIRRSRNGHLVYVPGRLVNPDERIVTEIDRIDICCVHRDLPRHSQADKGVRIPRWVRIRGDRAGSAVDLEDGACQHCTDPQVLLI